MKRGRDEVMDTTICSVCKKYKKSRKTDVCEKCYRYVLNKFYERVFWQCYICGYPYVDVHHIKPISKSGKHEIGNLILLCPTHHQLIHRHKLTLDQLEMMHNDKKYENEILEMIMRRDYPYLEMDTYQW